MDWDEKDLCKGAFESSIVSCDLERVEKELGPANREYDRFEVLDDVLAEKLLKDVSTRFAVVENAWKDKRFVANIDLLALLVEAVRCIIFLLPREAIEQDRKSVMITGGELVLEL